MSWEDAIYEVIRLVKSAAPELWRIARMQVYAEVVGFGVWFLILAGVGALLAFCSKGCKRKHEEKKGRSYYDDDWLIGHYFLAVLATLAAIMAIVQLDLIVVRFVNPDYYAIKIILGLVQ